MNFRHLTKEWMITLLLALLLLALSQSTLFARIDGWLLTFGQHLARSADKPLDKLVVIDIDKAGLATLGGRAGENMALAEVLEKARRARHSTIGVLMPLSASGHNLGLTALDELKEAVADASLPASKARKLEAIIDGKQRLLDVDSRIAHAIAQSKQTVLALHAEGEIGKEDANITLLPFTPYSNSVLHRMELWMDPLHEAYSAVLRDIGQPDATFAKKANGIGWVSLLRDNDDRSRGFALIHPNGDKAIPGMPLLLAAVDRQKESKIAIEPGKVFIGDVKLTTDAGWRSFIHLYHTEEQMALPKHYSLNDLLADNFKTSSLNGKIILLADDAMLQPVVPVDGGEKLSIADFTAIATANVLNHDAYARTASLVWLELLLFILSALLLALLIPRLHFGLGIALAAATFLLLIGATEYLLLTKQLWLKTALPVSLLLAGMLLIALRRIYAAQAKHHQREVAHTLRQLGLAYQEQNKLELAFEAFLKLPPDQSNLEMLYNLALDFERRRRYERAVAAYRHILHHSHNFKDVVARKLNAEKMERALTTSSGQFTASVLLMPDENGLKPHLGRYEVEKELGRGAMGAVYLGRDPKIDRVVAIKTLALSREFEADELQEVESRFFHEAAAAGRLNHPNIVTIYDAGEEHDLAYIAMEFIDGKPLSDFVQEKKLLPVPTVLNIIAQVASGLDYAFKQEIVHRDIKPGNIMYNEKNGSVKIADFGIARITSSSRTKTGTILGTPSYMSPEQISSQAVDGRSDIFSLGSTLFTLLTGKKAFSADSIAALSYQITSEKHPDPIKLRPSLPACVKTVIDKALQKDPANRYQDGMAMRRAIIRCLKTINGE